MSKGNEESSGGFFAVVIGVFIGMIVSVIFIYNVDSDRASLEACEKDLPRSNYCVMIAVPSTVVIDNKISSEEN